MMYAFLPNKQRQSYNRAFSLLKDAAMTNGLDLDPATVLCDFKLAIIQALALNFPNIIIAAAAAVVTTVAGFLVIAWKVKKYGKSL